MGAKAPIFDVATPMDIHALGPLVDWTDAVTPMVIVGITASGPPQNGHAEFPEVIHCLLAIAIDIGNRRFLADPQTAVNTSAKMLGEMTVKFRANDANFCVSAHDNFLRG